MYEIILYSVAFCILCMLVGYGAVSQPRISFWLMWAIVVVFPFVVEASDWNGFDWAKRYTILATGLIITWLYRRATLYPDIRSQTLRIGKGCFIFFALANVIEVAVFDFFASNIFNSILLSIIALLVPLKWVYNNNKTVIAFRDSAWCIAASISFGYTYIFNRGIEDSVLPALLILIITIVGVGFMRDWLYWGPYRIFYLMIPIVVDSISPHFFKQILYPAFLQPENRLLMQDTWLEFIWLAAGTVAVAVLIAERLGVDIPLSMRLNSLGEEPNQATLET